MKERNKAIIYRTLSTTKKRIDISHRVELERCHGVINGVTLVAIRRIYGAVAVTFVPEKEARKYSRDIRNMRMDSPTYLPRQMCCQD